MRISIQKFSITNYRSCSHTSFAPCTDLSALIGKNASGKNSILNGLLKSIVDLIKSYSTTKQIVISTHSDFVLDSLAPENVFLVRKEHRLGTKIKPVSKTLSAQDYAALKTYLAESGNLGEFWRHGGLGHD